MVLGCRVGADPSVCTVVTMLEDDDRYILRDDEMSSLSRRVFGSLDRKVIVLTIIFWTINAAQLGARAMIYPTDFNQLDGVGLARLASLFTGIILTLGMWALLRGLTETRAFAWFWRAAALGVAVCLLHTLLNAIYFKVLTDYHALTGARFLDIRGLASTYISFLWPIMTWSALCAIMVAGENLRSQQERTSQALAAAQQARLAALQLQIQPHFLLNTLNAISSLIGQKRTREADVTLLRLAAFLKHSLTTAPRELVRLDAEVEIQSQYLDIEEVRFSDRLSRRLLVEPEAAGAMVPSLILQPFVENAIKHGLSRTVDPMALEIGARREGERLHIWVEDDAHGDQAAIQQGLGRSLSNAGRRLALLYGPHAALMYGPVGGGGWRVDIDLPFEALA